MPALPFVVAPHPLPSISTGNQRSEKPAAHLAQFKHIGMTWRSNGSDGLWLRGDFGQTRPVDFIGMLQANASSLTRIRVRLGATQIQVDGIAPYDSGEVDFIYAGTTREDGLYHSHIEIPSVVNARWWRIDIISHAGDFEAAKLIIGRKITAGRYYDKGFEFGIQDQGTLEYGRYGVPEEEDGLIFRTITFKISWISSAEYEGSWRPLFEKIGRRTPVLLCFDPTPSATRQSKTYFGTFPDPPFATGGTKPGTYAQDYSLLSYI